MHQINYFVFVIFLIVNLPFTVPVEKAYTKDYPQDHPEDSPEVHTIPDPIQIDRDEIRRQLGQRLQFKSLSCRKDLRIVNTTQHNVRVEWPSSATSSSVLSNPPCVNKNNILVTRSCKHGHWSPIHSNDCVSVQIKFQPKCKTGDIEVVYNETVYCVYTSSKLQNWTADLPVVDVEDITQFLPIITQFLPNIPHKTIWLPVKRTEKYGKFIWKISKNYYRTFTWYNNTNDNDKYYKPDYVSRDCMICNITNVAENSTVKRKYLYQPTDCKANHKTVHIYKPESRYFVRLKDIIYSTETNNAYFVGNNCRTLAQPKTEEDNFAIQMLITNRTCRIGIERDGNGAFKWQNSSMFINYTDWLPSTNFSNSVVVISKDGWTLVNNINDVQCAVCQVDHTKYKTELIIKPNKIHSNLIVTIYSAHKMVDIVANTIGLEDISLGASFSPVDNDDTNLQDNFDKLNIRKVGIVNFRRSNFNYYYFRALVIPNNQELITDKIFFSNSNDREYAFKLEIKNLCNSTKFICDPHLQNFYNNISVFLLSEANNAFLNHTSNLYHKINITSFRAIKILKIDTEKGDIKMLYHLRINDTLLNIVEEYESLKRLIEKLNNKKLHYLGHKIELDSFKSCMGCLPEFDKKSNRIFWEYTETGKTNTPIKNCLRREFLFSRKCGGNFLEGAKWEDPNVIFNINERSEFTEKFCNLYETSFNVTQVPQTEIFKNLSELTKRKMELKAADIFYVSEIMRKEPDPTLLNEDKQSLARTFSLIINNMIAANETSLEEANRATNSTNIILATAEKRLQELTENNLDQNGVNEIVHENYMFRTSDPFVSGITGLALLSPRGIDNPYLTNYTLRDLTANMSIEEIISWEDLDTAIYVPQDLLDDIRNHSGSQNVRISISIYYNDSLFIEDNKNGTNKTQLASRVYDVTIKGYENYLKSPLPIITKLKVNSSQTLCAYWVFGSALNNLTSGWMKENKLNNTIFLKNNTIQICNFTHLTNFAMLLGKKAGYDADLLPEENTNLEIITAVGCLFSTIGICGIFLTAVVFKSWRQKVGTKVLLNVSACILLQMILLYLNMKYSETICIITGTLLHYSVLCGFSWSLIMAVLQYLRFVRVMGGPTSHLLLKASIVGWILPVIPVIAAFVANHVNNKKYVANLKELGSNICYPQDLMLYLTLLLPVTLIVLANLTIFLIILYNIAWKPSIRNTCNDKRVRIQQLKLAILLFFLLGLTWIVGLISVIHHSVEFLYFFSATATMQGFILFLFYVVLDQGTCGLWCKMLKSKVISSKKMSQSQQTTTPTAETNTSCNNTKEESGVSLTEVADWNTRVQAVMQELEGTHRVGNGGRSKHQMMS